LCDDDLAVLRFSIPYEERLNGLVENDMIPLASMGILMNRDVVTREALLSEGHPLYHHRESGQPIPLSVLVENVLSPKGKIL
jgi:hypothetical protein